MKQIDVQEGAKRQHRTVALFCVIQCWVRGLEGVILNRSDIERLVGIERFKETRIYWIAKDFAEFFPVHKLNYEPYVSPIGSVNYNQLTFSSLTVSRVPIDQNPKIEPFKLWELPTRQHLGELYEGFIPFFADYANYDERLLASYLLLLAQGQISPKSIPPLSTIDQK